MAGFKSLFDAGQLSIVNGVGYPNPNRSHFRATEIWQTASDTRTSISPTAWMGRYFDNACQGCDPTVAINIGPRMPQAFLRAHADGDHAGEPEQLPLHGREAER